MELTLSRHDLLQVSATCRKSMRLLPMGKKRAAQKLVIGDDTGCVLCFGTKKGEVETIFKTPPGGREVGRISLSGAGDEERVGIFWSCGTTIRACNRKGKEHLKFNTNLAEPIRSLHVEAEEIYAGGEYIFSQFTNCKDSAFFMAGDRINDLATEKISGAPKPDAVLGCQDRCVRVLTGSDLLYEASMDGPVSAVERYSNPPPAPGASGPGVGFGRAEAAEPTYELNDGRYKELLYGTENGLVGQLLCDASMMRRGWVISPIFEGRRGKSGGVHALSHDDVTHDGMRDLLVGRDDGTLEVWSFDLGPQPKLIFERSLQESITSLEAGFVTNVNYDELVVATYSGKLISFSSEPSTGEAGEAGLRERSTTAHTSDASRKEAKEKGDKKIRALRTELEGLRQKVDRPRNSGAILRNYSDMPPPSTGRPRAREVLEGVGVARRRRGAVQDERQVGALRRRRVLPGACNPAPRASPRNSAQFCATL